MHGIAFSASYQMVARFANKNTISLGLGCVGSGLLALFLEVALQIGPAPSETSFIMLFEVAAGTDPLCMNPHTHVLPQTWFQGMHNMKLACLTADFEQLCHML